MAVNLFFNGTHQQPIRKPLTAPGKAGMTEDGGEYRAPLHKEKAYMFHA
jgi:hypothetical protein